MIMAAANPVTYNGIDQKMISTSAFPITSLICVL